MNTYHVYLLTNKTHSVLYTGVTNNLERRLSEHRAGTADGFTKRYKTHKLVHMEDFGDINAAIAREKQIKGWVRTKKDELVNSTNPEWKDLSADWY